MNTLAADCEGLIPIPSLVIMALVAGSTWNSSAANWSTAVNGAISGTLNLKIKNKYEIQNEKIIKKFPV